MAQPSRICACQPSNSYDVSSATQIGIVVTMASTIGVRVLPLSQGVMPWTPTAKKKPNPAARSIVDGRSIQLF